MRPFPCAALLLAALAPFTAARAEDAKPFVYAAPNGPTFTVTADGLCKIELNGKVVAQGNWHAFNAGPTFFKDGAGEVVAAEITEKSVQPIDAKHVRVRQVQKDLVTNFEYAFDGEDVRIRAQVENRHATAELKAAGFEGLMFEFAKPPSGLMLDWHISYLQHQGLAICHPGHFSKIGGSYATDGALGVGLSPQNAGLSRTLFLWNWVPEDKPAPKRGPAFIVPKPIAPGGAETFEMSLRVSASGDWKHLLEPYKEYFARAFGPVHYKGDNRPWVQFSAVDKSFVKPDNPLGYHPDGLFRRMDKPEGVKTFCDGVLPALKEAGGQGVIFWAYGGYEQRGAMYRPDFDVLPPEPEKNLPQLKQAFADAKMRLGFCARPGEIAYRKTWTQDEPLRINPDDPAHIEMMLARFKKLSDAGANTFYLDSFGNSLDDVKAMRKFRERLGPDVQTFSEICCDAVLAYSGAYFEVSWKKEAKRYEIAWFGDATAWEQLRWLAPGVNCVCKIRVNPGDVPADAEPLYEFMFRNHLTPIVEDWQIKGEAKALKEKTSAYLDEKGQWKK